uniref:Uncharacterized protein n=1 Tax=Anopheles melas TaxID=34690 RepID=A0A182TX52_9DIPT
MQAPPVEPSLLTLDSTVQLVQTVGKLGGEDLGGSVREDDPVAHTIGDIVHEVLAVGGIDVPVATVRHIIRTLYLVLELIVHCLHMVTVIEFPWKDEERSSLKHPKNKLTQERS